MDINTILKGMQCTCGKFHHCDIESVFIESDAIRKNIKQVCRESKNILIVADENTYGAAGGIVESELADKEIKKVVFGSCVLIPNEDAIAAVNKYTDETDMIVGIGSGVIQDLCKYVSFFSEIPYIVVATAPSMDGYASDGAAMILNGMKTTVKAGLPRSIIADTNVLKNAPTEMIRSGYGDIVGKYSALCDWQLSRLVNNEYFCQYIYDTTYDMMECVISAADGIANRDEESVRLLMEALVVVGIMMSFAGSSRPASGSEHHLSHFFEIVGIVKDEPYLPHGIDVAYSTVVTAKIRENIINADFPTHLYRLSRDEYVNKISEIYGGVAEECVALQDRVGNYSKNRISVYKEKENEIRAVLAQMPSHKKIIQLLGLCGLNMDGFYKTYGAEKILTAVSYAKDLKDRYTVLWMYYDMFGDNVNLEF